MMSTPRPSLHLLPGTLALGFGLVGFAAKSVIKYFIGGE